MLHWRQFFTGQAVPDTAGHVTPLPLHMPVVTFSLKAGQQTWKLYFWLQFRSSQSEMINGNDPLGEALAKALVINFY